MIKRRHGAVKTSLHFTFKAYDYYCGCDPLTIYEYEDDDGRLTYSYCAGAGEPESVRMSEEQLNRDLEAMRDDEIRMTARGIRDRLWDELNLANRAITFHIAEDDTGCAIIAGGIIGSMDDMYESDAYSELCETWNGEEEFEYSAVVSYMIGDGEADHADHVDVGALERERKADPDAFDQFIRHYADQLCALRDFTVVNMMFDAEDDEAE